MAKRYSQAEIEILKAHPGIKNIRENRITLEFNFRKRMYEEWIKQPSVYSIRNFLKTEGIDIDLLGSIYINAIQTRFKRDGKPSRGKNEVFGVNTQSFRSNESDNEYLISTGKFIKGKNGISFHPDFINEIYHQYPNKSTEDVLKENGINPEMVGYQRIYHLKRSFDGEETMQIKTYYDDTMIQKYQDHPYILGISSKQIRIHPRLLKEAQLFKEKHIDDILSIFEIDYKDLNYTVKNRLLYQIRNYYPKKDKSLNMNSHKSEYILMVINHHQMLALETLVNDGFQEIKMCVPYMTPKDKKTLCEWLNTFPFDRYAFKKRKVLEKVGISKTSFYAILSNPHYGKSYQARIQRDEIRLDQITEVLENETYPLGSRMVYMRLKANDITIGRHTIMRLMRENNLCCPVRKANVSRQSAQKLLEENVQPNLLKRQFRIGKPMSIILTDVSYLKYGTNQTAYLSSVKDAVSGRKLCWVVSEHNDLKLALDTLNGLKEYQFQENVIFHSDQGTLYLNKTFQNELINLGFRQSMSRRGNCWDNASQESFFGHLKDECQYRSCTTIEEVREKVDDYMIYYNERRPQWTRNQMTPIAYEKYLNELDETTFNQYLKKETEKYDTMMAKAVEKAKKRAKDIGISEVN